MLGHLEKIRPTRLLVVILAPAVQTWSTLGPTHFDKQNKQKNKQTKPHGYAKCFITVSYW